MMYDFNFQRLFFFIVLFQYALYAQIVGKECGHNYVDAFEGNITFDSRDVNDSIHECHWNISGLSETYVQLLLTTPNVDIEGNDTLEVSDGSFGMIFSLKANSELTKNLTVNSLTNSLLISLTAANSDLSSSFSIPFVVLFKGNSSITTHTNSSGIVTSRGSTEEFCINYVHTHQIDVGQVNGRRIYLYLWEMDVDDGSGNFVAIGSGKSILGGSPAMLLTGKRKSLLPIDVESGSAYVFFHARQYSYGSGFTFFYNSTIVLPPTDEPPTTPSPPVPLNATISFDMMRDDVEVMMTRFVNAMKVVALNYCRGDFSSNVPISNLTNLDVFVVEAVYGDPCLVFVFYIVLPDNDTCLDHKLFTADDFSHMLGNYSSTLDSLLGRPILQSCNYDITVWVLLIAMLLFFSLALAIVVKMTTRNYNFEKSVHVELLPSDDVIKENPIFGAKVAQKDDNAFVLWSESEKPSNEPKFKSRKKVGLHLKMFGLQNQGFISDSPTLQKMGVTLAADNDMSIEDDVFFNRRKLSEETAMDETVSTCTVETPLDAPIIELGNHVFTTPNDVTNSNDDMDETKL